MFVKAFKCTILSDKRNYFLLKMLFRMLYLRIQICAYNKCLIWFCRDIEFKASHIQEKNHCVYISLQVQESFLV